MKRIMLILIILGGFIMVNAQMDKEYNTYRYEERKAETEQINTMQYQEFLTRECDALELKTLIKDYNMTKNSQYLHAISGYNCSEVTE